jgi:cupin fold WbuC family metalloprotein
MGIRFFDAPLLDGLVVQARTLPRRRAHHNLHTDLGAPAQRLLVAMEPDSYVRPHCHLDPDKAETLIVLRGSLGVLIFDGSGAVTETQVMRAGGAVLGYDVPPGVWHSIVALESGTVFAEAKAGPYVPLSDAEWGGWAPPEGESAVAAYLAAMTRLFTLA